MEENNNLPHIILSRVYNKEGTIGKLIDQDQLICYTLERPNLNNQQDTSCIPEGIYKVISDNSGEFKYFKIIDVPKRSQIEIHYGNCILDIKGCIIVGESISHDIYYKKYNQTFSFWLNNSKKACNNLKAKYPKGFLLTIKS